MATQYSNNYNSEAGLSSAKAPVGDVGGRVRSLYFTITLSGAVIAISDVLKLAVLPAGARIVGFRCIVPSLGTTGIFDLGWAASADAVETADPDGIVSGLDAGGQAVNNNTILTAAYGKKFASAVDIQAVFTEATTAADGVVLKGHIEYVVE